MRRRRQPDRTIGRWVEALVIAGLALIVVHELLAWMVLEPRVNHVLKHRGELYYSLAEQKSRIVGEGDTEYYSTLTFYYRGERIVVNKAGVRDYESSNRLDGLVETLVDPKDPQRAESVQQVREYDGVHFGVGSAVVIASLLVGLARLAYIFYIWRRSPPQSPIGTAIFAGLVGAGAIAVGVSLATQMPSSSGAHGRATASAYVTVPEVRLEDNVMAFGTLADAGVKPVAGIEGSSAPLGTVIRTRPPTGQRVRRGSTVTAVFGP